MTSYQSVDALQNALAGSVFARTDAPKKAAGRALGTLIELITFYMLRDWGLEQDLAIERPLPEYGNPEIRHNVEFSLHASDLVAVVDAPDEGRSITGTVIRKALGDVDFGEAAFPTGRTLRKGRTTRHACTLAEAEHAFWNSYMTSAGEYVVARLRRQPYAMAECKRVGVEEGQKKGPQTIEKAKQGAYVARAVSGLQRVPRRDGSVAAVVESAEGALLVHEDYDAFLRQAIEVGDSATLSNIVVTIGVVSNHGNWFTAEDHNKEMRVLAQSYDWLLFLTDEGLAEFIEDLLLGDDPAFASTKSAFQASHGGGARTTTFTKVTIDTDADRELTEYFAQDKPWGQWFKVITPSRPIDSLREDLHKLSALKVAAV